MPTVEIVRFPGSDAFVDNQLVFKECLSTLIKSEGCISSYYGIQVEDKRTGYLFVIWETYDHHMKLTKHESYPGLIDSLNLARSAPLDVQHVDFDEDAAVAFGSGATEVVTFTPHPDVNLKEAQELVKTLTEQLLAQKACHSVVVGESREKKGTYFMLVGWDSVQSHLGAVSKDPFPETIKKLHALAEIDLKHTELTKYIE
ncbi:hypothetical protein C0991_006195 [Blastosporella zonata]|nr:hypothetical protein C0991_006195 [Blastosporella zonata]